MVVLLLIYKYFNNLLFQNTIKYYILIYSIIYKQKSIYTNILIKIHIETIAKPVYAINISNIFSKH